MLHSSGTYYDGNTSRGVPVQVVAQVDGRVVLRGEGLERDEALADLRLEQPPGHAQPCLHWPDGGMVELADPQLLPLFANRSATRIQGALQWTERHPAGLVAALLLGVASLAGLVVVGLPLLAAGVSAAVPLSLERKLGTTVLAELDQTLLQPSQLPPATRMRLQGLLEKIQPLPPSRRRLELQLRQSSLLGANALCLPGGVLVVTDGLVRLGSDDELLAVLAHEAGHDHHRHPLQMLVRGQGLALVTGLFGDGGKALQGLSQTLVRNAYSRRFELEADREAVATLRRWNRPPEAFFSILDKLERERGATKLPSILLTHPSNQEREARARAGLRSLPP